MSCSKGILNGTLETVEELLLRVLPARLHARLAFLSGPSFAAEVARGLPTMVTVAARDEGVAAAAQVLLSAPLFRCYRTTDVTGVEMGGALKNVLAIACGISDGLNFGANARAALITRGLAEVTTLATAKGGHPLTMLGLGGIGDLVLTWCAFRGGVGGVVVAVEAAGVWRTADWRWTCSAAFSLTTTLATTITPTQPTLNNPPAPATCRATAPSACASAAARSWPTSSPRWAARTPRAC